MPCPTSQLAAQVHAAALREGLPALRLDGGRLSWNPTDVVRYESAQAIAVTNYSTVFNSSPKIGSPGAILFDDAHAGEQWVAEAWSVTIEARSRPEVWAALMDALHPSLDGMFFQRVTQQVPDPAVRRALRLVVPARVEGLAQRIDSALGQLPAYCPESFDAVRGDGLESCLVYVGWRKVLIRPFVPPTFENRPFEEANQRVYLSATLGRGGELERAFGRPEITRLPLPPDSSHPRNRRRYFVFADLLKGAGSGVPRQIVEEAGKALVLAPSDRQAEAASQALSPPHLATV
jgi:hypothetical protein